MVIFPKTNQIRKMCRESWKMNFRHVLTISQLSAGTVMERIHIFKTIYGKRNMEMLGKSVIANSTSQSKSQQSDILNNLQILSS